MDGHCSEKLGYIYIRINNLLHIFLPHFFLSFSLFYVGGVFWHTEIQNFNVIKRIYIFIWFMVFVLC